tara:strand:+ start:2115 stop:2702 length:588 start_codon:yes stop_codon:yes gene_type:complete
MNKKEILSVLNPEVPAHDGPGPHYAVSVILDFHGQEPEIFFIERAEHENDHWSGHIAFPGGRWEPHDPSLVSTAIRETAEEVGFLSKPEHYLGYHTSIPMRRRGQKVPGSLHAFCFSYEGEQNLKNNYEVKRFFSCPISYFIDPQNMTSYEWQEGPRRISLPAIRMGKKKLWGLTYLLLIDLLNKIKPQIKLPGY